MHACIRHPLIYPLYYTDSYIFVYDRFRFILTSLSHNMKCKTRENKKKGPYDPLIFVSFSFDNESDD